MRARIFLSILTICFSFLAYADDVSSPADTIYLDAERAFLKGDSPGAIAKLNTFFSLHQNDSSTRTVAKSHNLRGLIYFRAKNLSAAADEFKRAVNLGLQNSASDSVLNLARYNLANALFQSSQTQAAAEAIDTVEPQSLETDTRIRFYHLLGNIYNAREMPASAIVAFAQAANNSKESSAAQPFLQKMLAASKKIYTQKPKDDLDVFVKANEELPKDLEGSLAIQVFLARGFLYVGEAQKAEELLKKFLEKSLPSHPLRPKADELLQQMQKITEFDAKTIGILLPLSGKFAKFGRLCLNAALLAIKAYEDMDADPRLAKFRFAIQDSGESPESALEGFNKLVMEDHVAGVIGPLLSKQAGTVAQKAQEYGVPLFSLSQKGGLDQLGSYIFPIALTPNQQVETIVKYATEKLSYKRFAIMAPDDNFGDEYIRLFWDAAEAAGGEIVAIERYTPKSTDFREEIAHLLGLDFPDGRRIELEELKRRESAYAATIKVTGSLRKRLLKAYELKPVVDFDAVFVPDDPQAIGQIAPSFAVKDIQDLPLLGINTWNTPEIVQRAGRYLQKSLFVDTFFPHSKNNSAVQFIELYSKHFGTVPGTIEVQTYDAAKMALNILADNEISSRAKYRELLVNQGKYFGISGAFEFSETGIKRSAYLLTVKGSNIVEISSPESSKK